MFVVVFGVCGLLLLYGVRCCCVVLCCVVADWCGCCMLSSLPFCRVLLLRVCVAAVPVRLLIAVVAACCCWCCVILLCVDVC